MSDMRAIILVKKLTNFFDFVIKYFMAPQNIGENKVGVKMILFFSHHCTTQLKIKGATRKKKKTRKRKKKRNQNKITLKSEVHKIPQPFLGRHEKYRKMPKGEV